MSQLSFPQILWAMSVGNWGWNLARSSAPNKTHLTLRFKAYGPSELLEIPLDDDANAAILIARAMLRLDPDNITAGQLVPEGYQRYVLNAEPDL